MKVLILLIGIIALSGCSPQGKEVARELWEIRPIPVYCECPLAVQADCDKWVCPEVKP